MENIFKQIDDAKTYEERVKHILNANKRYKILADEYNKICNELKNKSNNDIIVPDSVDELITGINKILESEETNLSKYINNYFVLTAYVESLEKHKKNTDNKIFKVYEENKKIKLEALSLNDF